MSYGDFLQDSGKLYHLVVSGSSESYTASGESFKCQLEQLDAEQASTLGGQYGKTYRMYVKSGTNIRNSDKVEINDESYITKGVKDFKQFNQLHHKECILFKK